MPPAGYPAFLQYLQSGRVRKNQGYHLEHNYGHGEQNLSVVLALLMMLAFLVDQVQQLCCPLFQAAWHKMKTKCHLWEETPSPFSLAALWLNGGVADRSDTWHRTAEPNLWRYVVVGRRCLKTVALLCFGRR